MPAKDLTNVRKFLFQQQQQFPHATGELTNLLLDIILGCKKVGNEVRRFSLSQFQKTTGKINIQNEEVHELDELANNLFIDLLTKGGQICAVASEENEDIIEIPQGYQHGRYVVVIDPLDGFSNIQVNVNIGTIFSIRKKVSRGKVGTLEDFLRPGTTQVCAGYVMYGPSIVLVVTTGQGVYEFTHDQELGEFILSRENVRIPRIDSLPKKKGIYSVNEGYCTLWDEQTKQVFEYFKQQEYSSRHIGSFVADFHRNLLAGGLFAYPANKKSPSGKLRLLCELAPMSFIVEQAGGFASDGHQRILDIVPTKLHQRCPVYIGSADAVAKAEEILKN